MSVRIHQISKQTGIANKELIALLTERGYNVTSPSSSIDNISAESLIQEFKASGEDSGDAGEGGATEAAPAESGPADESASSAPAEEPEGKPEPESPPEETGRPEKPGNLPPGVFVKSADDVRREREEKEESRKTAQKPSPSSAPPPAKPAQPPAPPRPPEPGSRPTPPPPPSGPRPMGAPPTPQRPPSDKPAASSQNESRSAVETETERKTGEPAEESASGKEEEAELRILHVKPPIVVRDFAEQLGIKPFRLISELMEMNIFASMNQVIDESVAQDVAEKHGYLLEVKHRKAAAPAGKEKAAEVEKVDESKFLEPRPPIVCILGHVDHGKTTLLDYIRKKNVAGGEEGGITQHIGAYQIENGEQKITFLDTPGHSAFTKMRARGAGLTDIAVLVVAADDGFMPQTDEALKHAQAAAVPVVVAVNKMDTKGADLDRVKRQMQERGIPPEDLGGETIVVPISALKGEGVDNLLEMILLQAEVLELKANPKRAAEGIVIESKIEVGRGASATVIVQHGTLSSGDAVVCGETYAKVRAMFNEEGKTVKKAPPATPVQVIGWTEAPEVGGVFKAVKNEREARRLVEETAQAIQRESAASEPAAQPQTLENLFDAIESTRKKAFRVVVRCDVQGSLEAVCSLLQEIESEKVDLEILQGGVGMISRNDVLMASTGGAAIIGFNVKQEPGVTKFAKHHGVPIYQFNIIYHLVDQMKELMAGMLDPEYVENKVGAAEVRQVFPVSKKLIAGCLVTEGKIVRGARARLLRKGEVLGETRIGTLKRFKDDATEVRAGYECGVGLDKLNRFEEGDTIECFEVQEKRPTL